jgi:thiamine-phosphate pyrophosphorylase
VYEKNQEYDALAQRAPVCSSRAVVRPRVFQITAASVLPEPALLARIASIGALPEPSRRAFAVQLRDPELPVRARLTLGARLRAATRAIGASLIVNDRLDLAIMLGADGVHLGRRSVAVADARALLGSASWISVACHSVEDVIRAAEEGADAALLSPIFDSPGKGAPIGTAAITRAREAIDRRGLALSLVALGGVDAASAPACFSAGADAVAAIRADLRGVLDAFPRTC